VTIRLGDGDVSGQFRVCDDGALEGLVTGPRLGASVLSVTTDGGQPVELET
jgi:hypothetical protein